MLYPIQNRYLLSNARLPSRWTVEHAAGSTGDSFTTYDILIDSGRVAAMGAPGSLRDDNLPTVDLRDGLMLPRFVDIHTHLDKGHIWARSPNPDGRFLSALDAVEKDRELNWTADDVRRRMEFALRCAFAHGTGAIRTHIDSIGKQTAISWRVFDELRSEWKERIALQAVSLIPIDMIADDEEQFRFVVSTVARYGGLLGAVTFLGRAPDEKLDRCLDTLFTAAQANGLDLDFHVDESGMPEARTLECVAAAALRCKFRGRILTGHCCSLALADEPDMMRIIYRISEAGIGVVSLPMCNMYLQDRSDMRTPRWRGVAPLSELDAAGVKTMVASDNTRDPFYAYGDMDMLEVFREATRILHLDHSPKSWLPMLGETAAGYMGVADAFCIKPGAKADFVIVRARSINELNARPQSDRLVVVAGQLIDARLPDFSELDDRNN